MADVCANCKKTAEGAKATNLKSCAKCRTTLYCGRDCQKADWKMHKKSCAKNASAAYVETNATHSFNYSAPRLRNLENHVPNPFSRLDQGKFLHDRPETDVYKLLVDSFRMRQEDDMRLENITTPRSVYTGATSSIEPFRQYLAKAATGPALLPPWWSAEKQQACEAFGESSAWSDLRRKVTKAEMIQHYGDDRAPMQLRMLAEAIYGAGSMGQSGAGMRKVICQMEQGGLGNDMHMSMLSV